MPMIKSLTDAFQSGGYPALQTALTEHGSPTLTLGDISKILSISVSEVQGVESNALRKLRHPKISRELRAYIQEESMPEQGLTHEDYKET